MTTTPKKRIVMIDDESVILELWILTLYEK